MAIDISINIPTVQNTIQISPGALVVSTGGVGTGDLESAITVSNTDGAFTHVSSFDAGTSIESVLRQILEKYNRTTITLNSLGRRLQNTGGTYPTSSTELTSSETLEVGRGVQITDFRVTVGDSTQTTDDSVKFLRGSTEVETGFTDVTGTKTLSSTVEQDPGSLTQLDFKATVVDDGGAGLPDLTLSSGVISFTWRLRFVVGAASVSDVTTLGGGTETLTAVQANAASDALRGKSNFSFDCISAQGVEANYTWICYPSSFGNLAGILLDAGTPVLSDFESPVTSSVTNAYGHTADYKFYRSTYGGAFNNTQELTIQF